MIVSIFGVNVQNLPYDEAISVIGSKPAAADGGVTIELTLIGKEGGGGGGGGKNGAADDDVAAMDYTVSSPGGSSAGTVNVQLKVDGSVGLGLEVAPATADGNGLVVVSVASGGLAASAGMFKGDVVAAVNGTSIVAVGAAQAVRLMAVGAATGAVTLTLSHPVGIFGFAA